MARILILLAVLAFRVAAQAPSAELIHRVVGEIAVITGMEAKRPVPYETITRAGWKKWVDDEIRRSVKPEEIRREELALKKFGLVPQDFNLRQSMVDLLGEQAAALYDHRRKKMLFVEGGSDGMMGEAVLVHELAHAVADQHFDLRRFLDRGPQTDDAQTARLAVVEGQAMWVMLESQLQKMGQSLATNRSALDMMLPTMGKLAADSYPVYSHAPLYLRETLIFPYTSGLLFQQAAVEKYGKRGFSDVLRKPPISTQQVIHPDMYFSGAEPVKPVLPGIEHEKDYKRLTSGSVGELDFRILLQQYTSEKEAQAVAPGWRGGVFDLLEGKRDRRVVLRWSTEWASPETAKDFLRLYRRVLAGKWKNAQWKEESETVLAGTGDDGEFRVAADGVRVTAVEGLPGSGGSARAAIY